MDYFVTEETVRRWERDLPPHLFPELRSALQPIAGTLVWTRGDVDSNVAEELCEMLPDPEEQPQPPWMSRMTDDWMRAVTDMVIDEMGDMEYAVSIVSATILERTRFVLKRELDALKAGDGGSK